MLQVSRAEREEEGGKDRQMEEEDRQNAGVAEGIRGKRERV